ncbi:MAG TPA: putative LPS assembly protein LptD [Candidatus Hydrothermia bacterium]|nr:putative LPS assembly protein LptD [Candidatus Hydrothermia bacterium]HOL23252.1 putative LPS assembly protein LptD [Candidatus Hydrothermia bacterium]HOP32562.1 putative LPS assembly protein LptD [Candidatus Hydrothermia bacterium]HPO78262.1 putative LPS assembly protein LptD [Candidatus Hydrothermia bacterium]
MSILLAALFAASPLLFKAKEIQYFADSSVFVLKDSVKTNQGNTELFADSLIFFRELDQMKAFGNAVLIFGNDTLIGDSIYYNTETKNGFAFFGKINQEKGIFSGIKVSKDSTDTIYVSKGAFTTCENPQPHYRFITEKGKIITEDMAVVKPVIAEIHGIPVFGLPFWIFPLSKERKSGFMVPKFGVSSSDGKYFKNLSYYLVINNYSDLTLALDLLEKRGVRGTADFVFYRYRFGKINLSYSLAQEWNPWKKRWTLNGTMDLGPFNGFRITGRGNYLSDNEILNDYADIKENWLKKELTSFISFSKNFGNIVFSGTVDDRLNLTTNSRTSRIPSVQISMPQLRIGNLGLNSSMSFLRLYTRIDSTDTTRWGLKLNTGGSYSFRIFRYLRFSLGANGFLGILDADTLGNKSLIAKNISGNAGFSTVLYGRSIFGFSKIQYLTHTFQPSLSISYQPAIDNPASNFYFIPTTANEALSVNISATNTFGAMVSEKKIDLVNLNISSSASLLGHNTSLPFNIWNLSMNSLGILPFSVRLQSTYYRETGDFKNNSLYLSWNIGLPLPQVQFADSLVRNRLSMHIGYSLTKSYFTSQMLSLNGNFDFGKSFKVSFAGSYDLERQEIVSRSFTISKDLHCWEASFTYNGFGSRWDYNFKIYIKKLPDVKLEKSIFDLFLP